MYILRPHWVYSCLFSCVFSQMPLLYVRRYGPTCVLDSAQRSRVCSLVCECQYVLVLGYMYTKKTKRQTICKRWLYRYAYKQTKSDDSNGDDSATDPDNNKQTDKISLEWPIQSLSQVNRCLEFVLSFSPRHHLHHIHVFVLLPYFSLKFNFFFAKKKTDSFWHKIVKWNEMEKWIARHPRDVDRQK